MDRTRYKVPKNAVHSLSYEVQNHLVLYIHASDDGNAEPTNLDLSSLQVYFVRACTGSEHADAHNDKCNASFSEKSFDGWGGKLGRTAIIPFRQNESNTLFKGPQQVHKKKGSEQNPPQGLGFGAAA